MPFISIVVPVYNVEEYLSYCIESILIQTFNDYELILVNDGSTDNSASICDFYCKQSSKIKVIHQENKGVSAARNLGIRESVGEYILFVDSDDWLEKSTLEVLHKEAKNFKYSIVIFGWNSCGELNIKNPMSALDVKEKENIIDVAYNYANGYYYGSSCNKIFLNEVIKDNNIYFNETIKIGEDNIFNLEYLSYCDSCKVINDILYNYRKRSGSATTKFNAKDIVRGYVKGEHSLIKTYKKNNSFEEFKIALCVHYIYTFHGYISRLFKYGSSVEYHEKIKFIRYILDEFKYLQLDNEIDISLLRGGLKWSGYLFKIGSVRLIYIVYLFNHLKLKYKSNIK
ncbi:glycosyltransferase family 2 protein [Photobacterium phosphoreum]|uniref:glycosyltransferase family 2 protein n=1 Tax=Photobacterium phosphoreum TaxID=659 RepID=UPI000D1839B8|nr:glycosyltransferase family A protein [Photobacterium phosphoreum]PSU32579.1 hypothetical protein CTM85_19905 [Photobacterium phosphoreum]